MGRSHPDSVAFRHRSSLKLLTLANHKTPKGEAGGWLTGILYLAPHTSGGGVTLCPHSTEACRAMCLAGAGMSGLPRQVGAKLKRTRLWLESPTAFLQGLMADIERLKAIAAAEGLKPALRLNGSSDILWERQAWPFSALGVRRYDYTAIPLEHRRADAGYHLTYSYKGPEDAGRALAYLAAGHSVAAVVPEALKEKRLDARGEGWWAPPELDRQVRLVDGDAHDLRFLDPPGSLVLLKPKGRAVSSLIRPELLRELADACRRVAA